MYNSPRIAPALLYVPWPSPPRYTCPFLVEGDKTNTGRSPVGIVHRPLFTRHRVIAPTTSLITALVQQMRANVSFSASSKRLARSGVHMCNAMIAIPAFAATSKAVASVIPSYALSIVVSPSFRMRG